MLKSIKAEWDGFSAMVFRNMEPSKTQQTEMQKAFFAGAWALLNMIEEIGEPHISEQQGVNHLESIRVECQEFKRTIIRQYGEKN